MSRYDKLPLYKTSYDLSLDIFRFSAFFSREHKYTMGEEMKKEMFDLFILLYRTNSSEEKVSVLKEAREKIEKIRIMVRISKDLKLLSVGNFALLNEKIQEISKQLCGWQKSSE
jgi:hypothetical protein